VAAAALIPPAELGLFRAVLAPNFDACRVDGVGACWGVVAEKYRIIIFGRYPFEEQWRPLVATGLLVACWWPAACGLLEALAGCCCGWRWCWRLLHADVRQHVHGPEQGRDRPLGRPAADHPAGLAVDDHGLPDRDGGGAGAALKLPAIRTFCTIYVELIRGVPLISVLFMASFMFPLFMPQGLTSTC
jgi:general L-amino acid transport system permease protein